MGKLSKKIARSSVCWSLVLCLVVTMSFGLSFAGTNASATTAGSGLANLQAIEVIEVYSKIDGGAIKTDYIPLPRELDDYHRIDIYANAGVPYAVNELRHSGAATFEAYSETISDAVAAGLEKGRAVFLTGADGDTAVGVAAGMRAAFGEDSVLGVVYMDAVGDLDIIDGIMDEFDEYLFTDARDFASTEDYTVLNTAEFKDRATWEDAVYALAAEVDAIYLHIDADFLGQGYVSHLDAGSSVAGPDIWTMMRNIGIVMETGKVATINLASMYAEDPGMVWVPRTPFDLSTVTNPTTIPGTASLLEGVWAARGYEIAQYEPYQNPATVAIRPTMFDPRVGMPADFSPSETLGERINRFSTTSIRSGLHMMTAMFDNWGQMPAVPGAVLNIPREAAITTNFDGITVIEMRTSFGSGIVGRRTAASTANTYTWDDRGVYNSNSISASTYPSATSVSQWDEYRRVDLYKLTGLTPAVSEHYYSNALADAEYPGMPRLEAISKVMAEEIAEALLAGNVVFLNGNSCTPPTAIAAGVRRAYGNNAKLGHIWVDAHGDINTAATTYSGSLGGMANGSIQGVDKHPTLKSLWNTASGNLNHFDDLLHCTARHLDFGPIFDVTKWPGTMDFPAGNNYPYLEGEPEFGEMLNIWEATSDPSFYVQVDTFADPVKFKKVLDKFAARVDVIYLHIDMDSFDNGQNLNSGSADDGYFNGRPGQDIWCTMENFKAIAETGKLAVFSMVSIGTGTVNANNLALKGFNFPTVPASSAVAGTTPTNDISLRHSTYSLMQAFRTTSAVLNNWKDAPMPFDVVSATPSAVVTKLTGNQNDLTITVREVLLNGDVNIIKVTLKINNNAAGTYKVGNYKVYVDTKGNTQIRECYIVK